METRFRKTAHVYVLAHVQSIHELQQMVGRSCRTRGSCEATLYIIGTEKPAQVNERLRHYGVMALMDQERLLELLEKKARDHHLLRSLNEARDKGKLPKSLEELRADMGEQAFNKLTK